MKDSFTNRKRDSYLFGLLLTFYCLIKYFIQVIITFFCLLFTNFSNFFNNWIFKHSFTLPLIPLVYK
jgi:hypothetical protein